MDEKDLLPKIQAVAVLPFADSTFGKDNTLGNDDLVHFAEEFANHLVGGQTFKKVLYPQECLEALAHTQYSLQREEDLKEMAELLKVDAIIFGVIKQYRMYYPPELSISMRFYLTRLDRFATSMEISELAHSGVPLHGYDPTFFRQLWDKSGYYDGSSADLRQRLDEYLKAHPSTHKGWTDERALRTKADFLSFVAFDLAGSLHGARNEMRRQSPSPNERGRSEPRKRDYFGKI